MSDPAFGEYGRLIFPVDGGYYSGDTLGELRLTWHNNIDPDKTVEIVNYMKDHAGAGLYCPEQSHVGGSDGRKPYHQAG